MKTSLKLTAYGAALAALVAGTYLVGAAVGPTAENAPAAVGVEHADDGHTAAAAIHEPGGLASTRDGYTFVPESTTLGSGTFAFRVTGPTGPVTAFDIEHDRRLHLIVVRRDGTAFQHLHPEMDAAGTWRVPLTVPAAGVYRAFADFTPTGGPATTLGVDLFAPGDFQPVAHAPAARTSVVDGFTVTLDGDLTPGAVAPLTLTISRDGAPVAVQPYLGAYGHLVALRDGDLAYLHVHPRSDDAPGSAVGFDAEVPSAGTYRLFFDFQVDGVVRTADLTVAAS